MSKQGNRIWGVAAMTAAALSLIGASGASAASFPVNNVLDTVAANDGACTTDPGGCTLREAITAANANLATETDQITFSLPTSPTQSVDLLSQLPNITTPTTITGTGARNLIVRRSAGDIAILLSVPADAAHTVRITDLTAADGIQGIAVGGPGKTVIERVLVRGNIGQGGINQSGGILTVRDSTITNNEAGFGGGFNQSIPFETTPQEALIVNSTIAGNRANEFGGGIHIAGTVSKPGKLTVDSSTITGNKADADNMGGGSGGGIFNNSPSSDPFLHAFRIGNSIVAGNTVGTSPSASDPDCLGITFPFSSNGSNLVGTIDPVNCVGFVNADQKNVNPLIGTLADNGGPTDTVELLAGSPAIDAGIAPPQPPGTLLCPAADQRGLPRGGLNGRCDIGAFEVQKPPAAQPFPPANPAPATKRKKCKKKKKRGAKKRKCRKKKRKR